MLHITKKHLEEVLQTVSLDVPGRDFTRKDVELLIQKYFPRKQYLTKRETAEFLNLCERSVDYAREFQGLRWHKFGKKVMFAIDDIKQWADSMAHTGAGAVPSLRNVTARNI